MATTTWTQTAGMTSDEDTDNLESYAEQAEASKDAAAASATSAAASASAAAASEVDAENAEANASASETAAAASAASATSSATAASNSASSASTSATAAASSATAASASETAAAASESAAATSESNASTSETNAATSASNASTSETNAATSATNASTSETNAAASETAAAASETAAAASEAAAATSEANAATSEANAATSETNASNSASSASTSASNAATSATAASNAQTAAESARDATLTAYDNFDDRYLGTKASAPTLDNDGNALIAGALYFDSTAGAMRVYTGSAWVAAYVNGADYLALSGGTMTGDVAYGDNVKATFGASADLQIFHNGTNSYVADLGVGKLFLQTQGPSIDLLGSGGSDFMGRFISDGAVELYHDNAQKLATTSTGIDVTGTVVADGLTVQDSAPLLVLEDTDAASTHSKTQFTLDGGSVRLATRTSGGSFVSNDYLINKDASGATSHAFRVANSTVLDVYNAGINVIGTITADDELKIESTSGYGRIEIGGPSGAFIDLKSPFSDDYDGRIITTGNGVVLAAGSGQGVSVQFENTTKLRTTATGIEVTGSVDFGNWTITESGGSLYFATGGTNKMKLDASGNLDVVGSVNSNATIS